VCPLLGFSCLAYSSTLKREAVYSSETSDFHWTTRRYMHYDITLLNMFSFHTRWKPKSPRWRFCWTHGTFFRKVGYKCKAYPQRCIRHTIHILWIFRFSHLFKVERELNCLYIITGERNKCSKVWNVDIALKVYEYLKK
jgi:hypothetical protein